MAAPPPTRKNLLVPVGLAAVVLLVILAFFGMGGGDGGDAGREGGTAEDGLPAAVSSSDGEDAGVPAAGAGPIAQTAGEAADATGAEVDPQPEQPESN